MSLPESRFVNVPPMSAPLGSLAFPIDLDLAEALMAWRADPTSDNLFEVTAALLRVGLFDLNLPDDLNASIWLCRYSREFPALRRILETLD